VNIFTDSYRVPKSSDTYADALTAWGLATVLAHVLHEADVASYDQIAVEDEGAYFLVRTPQPLREEWLGKIQPFEFTFFLAQSREKGPRTAGAKIVYLDEEFERARRPVLNANASGETRELAAINRAHEHLSQFGAMSSLQADSCVNKVWELAAQTQSTLGELIRFVLWLFSESENDVAEADIKRKIKELKLPGDTVTACSLLNPMQGKGDNQAKPNGANPSNIKVLWIGEWLKIIGFHAAGAASPFRDARKQVKSYRVAVLVPRRIRLRHHREIFRVFSDSYYAKSELKWDCLAALRYANVFLRHIRETDDADFLVSLGLVSTDLPDVVQGFMTAGFMKTSQFAFSVSRISGYDLPRWIRLANDQTRIDSYLRVLEEHEKCLSPLDERRGEQLTMLSRYRDWLSSGDHRAVWDFFALYAQHRMQRAVAKEPCAAFTTDNLEVVFLNDKEEKDLTPILHNPGFRNIATAIRKGTINAQYRRQRKELPSGMDVHFGLSHELRRNARYRDKFMVSLCDYLNLYNLENLRVSNRIGADAKSRVGRKNIETSDIEAITQLVQDYGPELICGLLLAYGYAKDSRAAEPEDPTTATDDTEGNNEGENSDE